MSEKQKIEIKSYLSGFNSKIFTIEKSYVLQKSRDFKKTLKFKYNFDGVINADAGRIYMDIAGCVLSNICYIEVKIFCSNKSQGYYKKIINNYNDYNNNNLLYWNFHLDHLFSLDDLDIGDEVGIEIYLTSQKRKMDSLMEQRGKANLTLI